jgi:hypothetical protein
VIKLVICYTRVRPEHDGLFEIGTTSKINGIGPRSPLLTCKLVPPPTVTPTQIHTLLASSKEEMDLWLNAIADVRPPPPLCATTNQPTH